MAYNTCLGSSFLYFVTVCYFLSFELPMLFSLLLFSKKGGRTWTLISEYELTKMMLWVGYPPYNLTS